MKSLLMYSINPLELGYYEKLEKWETLTELFEEKSSKKLTVN